MKKTAITLTSIAFPPVNPDYYCVLPNGVRFAASKIC